MISMVDEQFFLLYPVSNQIESQVKKESLNKLAVICYKPECKRYMSLFHAGITSYIGHWFVEKRGARGDIKRS